MFAVDLHTHTRFFHAFEARPTLFDPLGRRLLVAVARRRGLDGVAVTNHDYAYRPGDDDRTPAGQDFATRDDHGVATPNGRPTTASNVQGTPVTDDQEISITDDQETPVTDDQVLTAPGGPVATIPGNEVSTTRGHVLVVGPDPPEVTRPGALTPPEVVDLAHRGGCVALMAHPSRNSTVQQTTATFDAVELNGKTPDTHEAARALAEDRDLPLVGGSDAHWPFEVGRAYTLVDAPELTPASVVDAIRDGRVEPVVAPDRLHAALEPLHDVAHRAKGHR